MVPVFTVEILKQYFVQYALDVGFDYDDIASMRSKYEKY